MKEKLLLDCTLRDGGYINSWNFGRVRIEGIFDNLAGAGLEFIETGFIDERVTFDENRSIMPDMASLNRLYEGKDRRSSKVLAMIDYGTCGTDKVLPRSESFPDGIRVIFKKHLRKEALAFCAELKEKGYMVFAQLVSVTSYNDDEIGDLIELANAVSPYAVSVVDTYGLLHQNNLRRYIDLLDAGLAPDIAIGYHGHNNFQMGYANCISVLERDSTRDLIVDGSLYGMGKSAGNAPTELVAIHMRNRCGKQYDIGRLLEAIDSHIMPFYITPTWGYNLLYCLAAFNDCHPNYVIYYISKKTLPLHIINELLGTLEGEKKLLYDEEYAERKYLSFRR